MKVLLDTNVVLDVLLDRRPHSADAAAIFRLIEEGHVAGLLCGTTITTVDYLLNRALRRADARHLLARLIRLFEIAPVHRAVVEDALASRIPDFEDAVLDSSARHAGADAVITRDSKGFTSSASTILDPRQFLAQWKRELSG